ncbi:MAG: DUF4157 domain-containing protein [Blastocatellia bacterium]
MMTDNQSPAKPRPKAFGVLGRTASPLTLQRKCACGGDKGSGEQCEACESKAMSVQRSPLSSIEQLKAPPIVSEVLRSPGQPLDSTTRAFMEPRFGHDFSRVRVHTDRRAGESARATNALAYTAGQNVVFGEGNYRPNTPDGKRLLAHELTHVVQQERTAPAPSPAGALLLGHTADSLEDEAERVANKLLTTDTPAGSLEGRNRVPTTVAASGSAPVARLQLQPAGPASQGEGAAREATAAAGAGAACVPAPGVTSATCSAYSANAWWLPFAYVNNATCACLATPNVPTANCVRKFLQDRLAAAPTWLKVIAASQKINDIPGSPTYPAYQAFVQTMLTPRIYGDHVDAYRSCCCPSGPAPYMDWMAVTSIPIQPCSLVGWFINHFGSCHGTPGAW